MQGQRAIWVPSGDRKAIDLENQEDLDEVQEVKDLLGSLYKIRLSYKLRKCSFHCLSTCRAERRHRYSRLGKRKDQFSPKDSKFLKYYHVILVVTIPAQICLNLLHVSHPVDFSIFINYINSEYYKERNSR
jgi:hypothetical protein